MFKISNVICLFHHIIYGNKSYVVCDEDNHKLSQSDRKLFENILPVVHQNYAKLNDTVEDRQLYLQDLQDNNQSNQIYCW